MNDHNSELKTLINNLRSIENKKLTSRLDLNKCDRLVEKLDSLSENCQECLQALVEFKNHFVQLNSNHTSIEESNIKKHKQLIHNTTSHLQKNHKLLPEGYYFSVFMSVGMSLGVVFGLTIFDNIALGIPVGMCIGIAIGTSLDSDAKKKGKTI